MPSPNDGSLTLYRAQSISHPCVPMGGHVPDQRAQSLRRAPRGKTGFHPHHCFDFAHPHARRERTRTGASMQARACAHARTRGWEVAERQASQIHMWHVGVVFCHSLRRLRARLGRVTAPFEEGYLLLRCGQCSLSLPQPWGNGEWTVSQMDMCMDMCVDMCVDT